MGAQVAQPIVTSYDVTFDSLEGPVHQVTLSPYWIGQTEVTQALWMAVMGQDGRCSVDKSDYPVNNMDWYSCALFCNKLSVLAGLKPYYVFNSRKETLYGASGKDQKGSFDIYLTNGLREDAGADGSVCRRKPNGNMPPEEATAVMDMSLRWKHAGGGRLAPFSRQECRDG